MTTRIEPYITIRNMHIEPMVGNIPADTKSSLQPIVTKPEIAEVEFTSHIPEIYDYLSKKYHLGFEYGHFNPQSYLEVLDRQIESLAITISEIRTVENPAIDKNKSLKTALASFQRLTMVKNIFLAMKNYIDGDNKDAAISSLLTGAFLGMVGEITAYEQKNTQSRHPKEFTTAQALQSFKDHFYFFAYKLGVIDPTLLRSQMDVNRFKRLDTVPVSDPFAGHENPFAGHENPFAGHENPFAGHENPFAGNVSDPFMHQ